MILPAAFIIGFAIGWMRARKRGGQLADKLQYGAVHGLAVMLAALIAVVVLDNLNLV